MKLSKRSMYGIQAAVYLAHTSRNGGRYIQSREIAQAEHMPAKFLESVLLALRSSELFESKVGAGGGYRLARAPDQITIAHVLTAMENDDAEAPADDVRTDGQFAMVVINDRLEHAIGEALHSLSLSELVELAEGQRRGADTPMYYI